MIPKKISCLPMAMAICFFSCCSESRLHGAHYVQASNHGCLCGNEFVISIDGYTTFRPEVGFNNTLWVDMSNILPFGTGILGLEWTLPTPFDQPDVGYNVGFTKFTQGGDFFTGNDTGHWFLMESDGFPASARGYVEYEYNSGETVVTGGLPTSSGVPFQGVRLDGAMPDGLSHLGDYVFGEIVLYAPNGWQLVEVGSPGSSELSPLLPAATTEEGSFVFEDATGDGAWFDPIATAGFLYSTDGTSNFTSVGLPTTVPDTDGFYTVVDAVNGSIQVATGGSYSFPTPVSEFQVLGIDPTVDGEDPQAFPTFLTLDTSTANFTMAPIPVPEPGSLVLAASCIIGLVGMSRFRHKAIPVLHRLH